MFPSLPLKLECSEISLWFTSGKYPEHHGTYGILHHPWLHFPPTTCLWFLFVIYSQSHDWLIASFPSNQPYHLSFLVSSTHIWLNTSFLLGHAVTFAWNSSFVVTLPIPTLAPCQLSSFISHNLIQTPCPSLCKINWLLLCGHCPHLDFCYCTYKSLLSSRFHGIIFLCWTMGREGLCYCTLNPIMPFTW